MKTILAPVDFSPVSAAVVREAAALARAFDGRVLLLNVVQPPVVINEYAGMLNIAELTAAGEKNAARQLEAFEQQLTNQFIKAATVQLTGSAIPAIVEAAKEHAADYVVMGSHGHSAIYDVLVGSTTHGVMMRVSCPVVIVPAAVDAPKAPRTKRRAVVA